MPERSSVVTAKFDVDDDGNIIAFDQAGNKLDPQAEYREELEVERQLKHASYKK